MKRKISKVLRNLALTVLIFSCIVMPVNAEGGLTNLEAVDYQEGMESLASVSEEEWLNSANAATFAVRNSDKEFIRTEKSNQTVQEVLDLYNIQKDKPIIGNLPIEDIATEETQIEKRVNDTYISGSLNEIVEETSICEDSQENDNLTSDNMESYMEMVTTEDGTEKEHGEAVSENATEEEDIIEEEPDDILSEVTSGEEGSKEDVVQETVYDTEAAIDETSQEQTVPIVGIEAYALNEDTMRNGLPTTETEILWVFTGNADIYYYGGFPFGYITKKYSDGFSTKFYTPGTYEILYYGENEDGEESELMVFPITVISEFECQTIEDNVSSEADSKSYSVDIDFTDMKAAAVCIVRTGKSNVQLKVTDENGNEIKKSSTTNKIPKRWIYIDKPSADAGICHYTVTVSAQSYNQASGAYRVIIGNKEDTEAMMGGLENAVDIDTYQFNEGNSINSTYSPNKDEYWFITPMPYPTVFTLLSDDSGLRYKLLDMDTLEVLFDSNDTGWEKIHSTRFTGSYSYAEKVTMKAFAGEKRYLVIYNNSPWNITGVREREFCFGAGQPMYGLESEKVYGSSVSVNSSSYSSTTLYADTNNFANTGAAYKAYLYGEPTGNMEGWRLKGPQSSSYQSGIGKTLIEFRFTPGGSFNTKVRGTWDLGIKLKSGRPSVTCTPSVNFMFYYEYGDDTITIDYKKE